jgi:D-isomer specific 2-hydroxyacid dehydrogenase, NAD binding domain/D-isomer specific 2-hydroxyacid dehydrogenase, catalytic domain
MNVSVLIVDIHADVYAKHLREEFPTLQVIEARNLSELPNDLSGVDVLIAFGTSINDETLRRLKRVRWIQSLATGVDHFLRCPYLAPQVLITSGRGIHGSMMREMTAFLMLSLTHDAARRADDQKNHVWERRLWTLLCGKTAVVVGLGVAGSAIGKLLHGFGMNVLGVSRTPRDIAGFNSVIPSGRLGAAAAQADFLINVLPGSPENRRGRVRRHEAYGLFHQRRAGRDGRRAGAYRRSAREAHRRSRPRRLPPGAIAARQPPVGHAERGDHAAYRRLRGRVRGLRDSDRDREHASFPGRTA